jgi:hypothetical protein
MFIPPEAEKLAGVFSIKKCELYFLEIQTEFSSFKKK